MFNDDLNTMRADDLESVKVCNGCGRPFTDGGSECGSSFEENLETPEEVAEYEAWLDESMDGDHESALESVYGPND